MEEVLIDLDLDMERKAEHVRQGAEEVCGF